MANYNLIKSAENAELVTGTSNSDSIIVGGNNVTVNASSGGDIIRLNGGKETTSLNGGKYDTTIWEKTDITNFVYGEGGNDSIYFNQSHVNANGGAGNDYFHVSNRDATVTGSYYYPRKLNDITISGGAGNDTVEIYPLGYSNSEDNNSLNFTIADFSNEDALFISENTYWSTYTYSDKKSPRRVITQRVENGNVIISDNSSVTSSGNNVVSKNVTPNFNITLQGVSDIRQVASAEYFIYDNYYNQFTKHSTLGKLFGVEDSSVVEPPVDKSTPTSGSGGGDTIIRRSKETETTTKTSETEVTIIGGDSDGGYKHPPYVFPVDTGTKTQPTATGGSSTSSVNNQYIIYSGGNQTSEYYESQQVNLATDFKGVEIQGNNFVVKSSSGQLTLQNVRNKFIKYGDGNGQLGAYSYLGESNSSSVSSSYSEYKTIDARNRESVYGVLIGGNYVNERIFAGNGGSSLWGGVGGNDTLTGGAGSDEFVYKYGGGNDVIQSATSSDFVNLSTVSLDQMISADISYNSVVVKFKDGGSLTVNGNTSGMAYRVAEGTFACNQFTKQWTAR